MADAKVPWWLTTLGDAEVRGVERSIRERHINPGPVTSEMERRLADVLDVGHVVLTTSGSQALLLGMLACDLQPGERIVMSAGGFIAAAHAALLRGATVRLVDVRPDRPVMDVAQLSRAIGDRTKVIVPTHMNGAATDMAAVNAVAADRGLKVVEDAAQAFCSRGEGGFLGTLSTAGAFSMGITKLITTGEGGFLATHDETVATHLRRLRNHGVDIIADNVFDAFGLNFRFNDMQAGVGLAQLDRLTERIAAVRSVHAFYAENLGDLHYLRMLDARVSDGELPLWAEALCAERDTVISLLAQRGIEARPFHPCLAQSPHLKCRGEYPNAEYFARHGLILPSGTDQPPENLQRTVDALHDIAGRIGSAIEPPGA